MSTNNSGSNLTSELTDLILVANAGNSSFVVTTETAPALYVDKVGKVGINTVTPSTMLEVNSNDGACMTLRYNKSPTAFANVSLTDTGDLAINPNATGSKITTNKSLDLVNHNGSTAGLKLGGTLVASSANELNYLAGVTPGSVAASKAVVLDSNKALSGVSSVSADQISGTIQTAHQPNITKLGTLESLIISGAFEADVLAGTLQTAEQPNITSVGTLDSLNVANGVTASQLTGTLQTAAQPNITSIGPLSSITVAGTTVGSELGVLSGVIPGAVSESKAVVVDSDKAVNGISSLTATKIYGTLQSPAQPNITSVGTLSSLTVTNGVTASQLTGTLQTAAQPNITSVGPLSSLTLAGSTVRSEIGYLLTAPGTAAASKAVVLDSNKSVTGITSVHAAQLSGTIQTPAQPNITSIGPQASITIAGNSIGSEAGFLKSATPGTAAPSKVLVLSGTGTIGGIGSLSATSLTGTLQTAAQPSITSVGTLSSLTVSGSTAVTSTTDSISSTTGALRVAGGIGVAGNMNVGGTINASAITVNGVSIDAISGSGGGGTVPSYCTGIAPGSAAASKAVVLNSNKSVTGITSLSTSNLVVSGSANVNSLTVNGVPITGNNPLPEYVSSITSGVAAESKALVVDASKSISGIGSLGATSLTGTLQTAEQPNITSVGTLSSITTSGNLTMGSTTITPAKISVIDNVTAGTAAAGKAVVLDSSKNISGIGSLGATSLTGTLQTAAQSNITSVGTLSSLTVSGAGSFGSLSVNGVPITGSGSGGSSSSSSSAVVSLSGGVEAGTTWTSRTTSINNNWVSVCWAPEKSMFVAISSSGTLNRIMTSTDGITWTAATTPAGADNVTWTSICWNATWAYFIAVGTDGSSSKILYSAIGSAAWTLTDAVSSDSRYWTSVCWSQKLNLTVAVANSGVGSRVMNSTTGFTSWQTRTTPADNSWTSVCWSHELSLFVAVASSGTGNRVMTSANGTNWTIRSTPADNSWTSVCWSADLSLFVAVASSGTGNRVMTSPDGTNWTIRTTPVDNNWTSVCWAQGAYMFIAVANTGTGNRVMTSVDGINWTVGTSAADNNWSSVCWSPAKGVIASVATSGTGNRVMTSSNTNLKAYTKSAIRIYDGSTCTSTTTGALTVSGGVGIAENANVGGTLTINSTAGSTSVTTGSLIVAGGAGISGSLYAGNAYAGIVLASSLLRVTATTDATNSTSGAFQCLGGAGISKNLYIGSTTATTSATTGALVVSGGCGIAGNLYAGGTVTGNGAYVAASDYRLKENVEPISYGLADIKKLRPVRYNMIKTPDHQEIGFIAHEVQAIIPEVVHGAKDAVGDDDEPRYQGVAYGALVPTLVKAIQEQSEMIDSLKKMVEDLSSRIA